MRVTFISQTFLEELQRDFWIDIRSSYLRVLVDYVTLITAIVCKLHFSSVDANFAHYIRCDDSILPGPLIKTLSCFRTSIQKLFMKRCVLAIVLLLIFPYFFLEFYLLHKSINHSQYELRVGEDWES